MLFRGFVKSVSNNEPGIMQAINGWMTIFWIVMIPIALYFGWLESVTFVSALSLWALVSGHLAAWQSARVEVEQNKEKREDTDGRLVKRIIKETEINPAQPPSSRSQSRKKKRKT